MFNRIWIEFPYRESSRRLLLTNSLLNYFWIVNILKNIEERLAILSKLIDEKLVHLFRQILKEVFMLIDRLKKIAKNHENS